MNQRLFGVVLHCAVKLLPEGSLPVDVSGAWFSLSQKATVPALVMSMTVWPSLRL